MKKSSLLLICLVSLWAHAEMYRWVDKNGVVQYTQTPPPGLQADKIKPAPPADANPGMDAVRALNQNAAKTRGEKEKKDAEASKEKAARAERCQAARERVTFMQERNPNRMATKNEDGSIQRMTADQYEKSLSEARDLATKNCD